jgi:hypothetical protein
LAPSSVSYQSHRITTVHSDPPDGEGEEEEDYLSDDSLQLKSHRPPPPRRPAPSIDNSTVISALTNDTTLQSFDPSTENTSGSGSGSIKIKKKKRKVWKMEPIPIRPYAQLPASNGGSVR